MEQVNLAKANLLYGYLDSRMNRPFYLRDESLNDAFLEKSCNG